MEYLFHIHYLLRKGLGPEWVEKCEDIYLDDLPEDTTPAQAEAMAMAEFHANRRRSYPEGYENNYRVTEVVAE